MIITIWTKMSQISIESHINTHSSHSQPVLVVIKKLSSMDFDLTYH